MTNEELDHLARCEDAMKQARWAIALQLARWRDGDSVCAVAELQNAYDVLADLVGEAKPQERLNSPVLVQTKDANIADKLCKYLKRALRLIETEYVVAKREHANHSARQYLAELNEAKAAIQEWDDEREAELANTQPARLIAAAPTMYDYIKERADLGDVKAKSIIDSLL